MTDPLNFSVSARAIDRPCQLYAHSDPPKPTRTQGHHRFPEYLQHRLWGETRIHDLLWVCGLCHDNIHEAIGWLLGESRKPAPEPGQKTCNEARRTVAWYLKEQANG